MVSDRQFWLLQLPIDLRKMSSCVERLHQWYILTLVAVAICNRFWVSLLGHSKLQ